MSSYLIKKGAGNKSIGGGRRGSFDIGQRAM